MTITDWPDWRGATVAIVASGESAKSEKVRLLDRPGIYTVAVKKSFELVPFAHVVYGCDAPWWRSVQYLPKFEGLKLSYSDVVCNSETGIRKVHIQDKLCDKLLFNEVGHVGAGGNSGFQALNLAAQFGASRIVLVGFDMQGQHWYGPNNWDQASNPGLWNFPRWQRAFENAAPQLKDRGIEVINASSASAVRCFKVSSVEGALEHWGFLQDAS